MAPIMCSCRGVSTDYCNFYGGDLSFIKFSSHFWTGSGSHDWLLPFLREFINHSMPLIG